MKLLIVDDSAMVRRLIESAYQGSVFTDIQTASDGILAVTKFKQLNPDVVTLDITMPHMDGLAALSQILDHNPKARVLVISALADHHTAIEALKRGASQFICKPFTAEDLRTALDELMNPENSRRGRNRRRRRSTPALERPPAPMTPDLNGQQPGNHPSPPLPGAGAPTKPMVSPMGQAPIAPPAPPLPGVPLPAASQNGSPNTAIPPMGSHPDNPAEGDYPSGFVSPPPIPPPMPMVRPNTEDL